MKVYLATDHAGFAMKEELKIFMTSLGYEVVDLGAHTYDPQDDYPALVRPVAEAVQNDSKSRGIILGGSGYGEAMVVNRFTGVRAMAFYGGRLPVAELEIEGQGSTDPLDIVRVARQHNDANILSIGARFVLLEEARRAVEIFLNTDFEGKDRHVRRIAAIDA